MVQMEEEHGSLEENFKDPPNEFRMMPFWFWNHEMVEKEIVRQVQDHHDHGIGGEFIHPRHGRLTPYMGRRWLEAVEAAADKCKELDMPCFLYDEDNWPSGPAGGYITGPYKKENRGKFVALFDEETFKGPKTVDYGLDFHALAPETEFLAAVAVPNPENYPDFSAVIDQQQDVTGCVNGDTFTWNVPEGEWSVLFFCILVNPYDANLNGYIDPLRKETVKEFIEFTHEKYANWFVERGKKDYLGTIVPGIFTDEPSMIHMDIGKITFMPWFTFSPDMPMRFEEMHGYPFTSILISMVRETGAVSAKHRCNYWATAIDMYVNAFYKQIYECCDKYNWRATGHVNSEGSFPSNIHNHGDFFKVFEYFHYGGVDQLTEEVRPDHIEDIWNLEKNPYTGMSNEMVTASKLASSAAHLLGKPRVLVEAFGTSSWDITMASAKRVTDFLILTGCDLFVPHSFNISEDGYRKGDHPAAFNYQPYYQHWKKLADHCGRLCALLNAHSGTLNADILMLYPAKSFHAEMMPSTSQMAESIGQYITHNADCIFRQQLDYEFANEEMIRGGTIEGNHLRIKDEAFKILLLGATTCINIEFARLVKQFYDAGGKILASYSLPYKEENTGESDEVNSIFEQVFGIDPKSLAAEIKAGSITDFEAVENLNDAGGHAILIKGPNKPPYQGAYYPLFETSCRKLLPIENRRVCAWKDEGNSSHAAYVQVKHKTIEGREFFFLANTGRDASYKAVKVVFGMNAAAVDSWNTLTGAITPVDSFSVENGKTSLVLDFLPNQSYLYSVVPGDERESCAVIGGENLENVMQTIDLGDTWNCKVNAPNGAMLYQDWHSSYRVEAGKAWGYRQSREFWHRFTVEDLEAIKPVKVVIEGIVGDYGWCKTTTDMPIGGDRAHFRLPSNLLLFVNDRAVPLSFDFNREYLDAYWIVADISKHLVEGNNVIKMTCTTGGHGTFHIVTDPWRLIGDFEADDEPIPTLKKVRDSVSLGDLVPQGFPRYHGGFSYMQSVDVPADAEGKKVMLVIDGTTDCVEVRINGALVDVLWWNWTADVTDAIKPGESNQVELVYYGIAQNMLQTNIKPQGIDGKVYLRILE
ncbi:MAG TPA: glycosyl hydrolase [Candidatus Lokiarchaeia archaeon]|nr:glycosyl hydrolase [Candidatus Lokiarchaeia archaeon]